MPNKSVNYIQVVIGTFVHYTTVHVHKRPKPRLRNGSLKANSIMRCNNCLAIISVRTMKIIKYNVKFLSDDHHHDDEADGPFEHFTLEKCRTKTK